jgi:CHAT domain-containing protein/tetratricopeptide (TPR) repeat protein
MRARVAIILAIAACSCGQPAPHQFESTLQQARLSLRRGEFAEARRFAADGERASLNADAIWPWRFRLLGAEAAILSRDFTEATPITQAALPPAHEFDVLRARQKYLAARVSAATGQLEAAHRLLGDARPLAAIGSDVRLEVDHLDGQVLMRLGEWSEAESLLRQVVDVADAADGYHRAIALNDLGMGHVLRSQFDEALPYFERVIALDQLRDFAIYASSLANAGSCYQRLGDFDRAMTLQRRALEIQEHRSRPEHFVQALGEMGNLYVLHDEPLKAEPYLKRAYDAAIAANLSSDAAVWANNLAEAETRMGRWDEAERYNTESMRLKASVGGRLVYNTLVAAGIAEGRGRMDEAKQRYEEAIRDPKANQSIRWGAHAGLAGVAVKQGDPSRAGKEFEAALDIIEQTRSDLLKTDYKLSYLTQLISFYRDYVDLLVSRHQVERALEVADSSRGQVLAERQHVAAPSRANVRDLQQLSTVTHTILVSYWLTPQRSFAWVVRPNEITLATLPQSPEIEALSRAHQAALANALSNPLADDSPGARLFRLVVAPAVGSVPPGQRIVIVPDGALHAINFETLPVDGARRHYWIEDVEIQVAPSLAALSAPARAAPGERTALVVGDPAPRPPEFPALRFAPAEMASIRNRLGAGRVTAFERERATPAAYREAQPGRYAFVHFAAHATANVDSPLDSAVILSGPDNGYKLYARDVAAQPLAAELVTVSACRSAGERAYSGEGLVGFAWAFLRAGARRVVAGLWDVEDRAAAALMDGLYERIAAGDPPARALHGAKLNLIKGGGASASPYAWGAFELFTVVP